MPEEGSIIQTSGHGGLLPPGMPIGKILGEENGIVYVDPIAPLNNIDFVQIILWRANSVSKPKDLDQKTFQPEQLY